MIKKYMNVFILFHFILSFTIEGATSNYFHCIMNCIREVFMRLQTMYQNLTLSRKKTQAKKYSKILRELVNVSFDFFNFIISLSLSLSLCFVSYLVIHKSLAN